MKKTITALEEELKDLSFNVRTYEEEYDWLESVMMSTSGNIDEIIGDFHKVKEELSLMRSEQSCLMKKIDELKSKLNVKKTH